MLMCRGKVGQRELKPMELKAPVRCVRHFSSYSQDYEQLKTSLDALQVAHLAGESIRQAAIEAGEREERVVGNLRACGGCCLARACLKGSPA